jgi:hypothetical protein
MSDASKIIKKQCTARKIGRQVSEQSALFDRCSHNPYFMDLWTANYGLKW